MNKFKSAFKDFICEGDKISAHIIFREKTYDITARILRDDSQDTPEQRDDGFWPSKDKSAAGYVLPENYDAELKKAKRIMKAWKNDEWFYCGVVLSVELDDEIIDDHAGGVWGIECNYPGSKNEYLTETANDLLDQWLHNATEDFKQTGKTPGRKI